MTIATDVGVRAAELIALVTDAPAYSAKLDTLLKADAAATKSLAELGARKAKYEAAASILAKAERLMEENKAAGEALDEQRTALKSAQREHADRAAALTVAERDLKARQFELDQKAAAVAETRQQLVDGRRRLVADRAALDDRAAKLRALAGSFA